MVIPAGVEMDLIACDNYCWVKARSDSEDWVLWFYVDPENPYQIEGPDGWVNAWDAMDGLLFAD